MLNFCLDASCLVWYLAQICGFRCLRLRAILCVQLLLFFTVITSSMHTTQLYKATNLPQNPPLSICKFVLYGDSLLGRLFVYCILLVRHLFLWSPCIEELCVCSS